MNATASLIASVMQLSDRERFTVAMTILDESSPLAMEEVDILNEAAQRQDEIERGIVSTISFGELVEGLIYKPKSLVK